MQGEHGWHRLVVADGVTHVTPVHMLGHFGGPAQPGGQTPLQCSIVGRNWGASAAKAPEDAVGPGWFPLLGTKEDKRRLVTVRIEIVKILSWGVSVTVWDERGNKPGVVCVCANIKFVRRGEMKGPLNEAFQDRLSVFSHIKLEGAEKKVTCA